jgi:hypothetical protein
MTDMEGRGWVGEGAIIGDRGHSGASQRPIAA